ncbi:ion channel [Halovivax limisalsi]|uniref:ion channel n=1 Tax=Halovivax limisalsi TaxID=1453760 RepID=UPI001FFD4CC1|nr:ion channel [Halovivax limisalsi]
MRWLYLVLGCVVLLATVIDILWTALWVDGGAGPISGRLTTAIWDGLRRVGTDDERLLSTAGPLTLVATLTLWIVGIWAGWTLLFVADRWALVASQTGAPADLVGRIYFVGYMMFTAGNGDYVPTADGWQLAAGATTASGMALVTLAVSYVLTVLGAVSEKRAFASGVTGLGERSEAFVRNGYDERDGFGGLERRFESLSDQLDLLADKHRAYPILHYYHSERAEHSSAVAVAIFDDALTLIEHGVDPDAQPNATLLQAARASTDEYLHTLDQAFIDPAEEVPPPPELERLRIAGIETVSDDAFADALAAARERRRRLLGVVQGDAWAWPPVTADED